MRITQLGAYVFLGVTHAYWMIGSSLAIVTGVYIPLLMYRWIFANKEKRIGKVAAFLVGH